MAFEYRSPANDMEENLCFFFGLAVAAGVGWTNVSVIHACIRALCDSFELCAVLRV